MTIVLVVCNSPSLVGSVILGETGGDDLRLLLVFALGVNLALTLKFAREVVEGEDLIVVTDRKHRVVLGDELEAPSLALVVRRHQQLFVASGYVKLKDLALAQSHQDLPVQVVQGAGICEISIMIIITVVVMILNQFKFLLKNLWSLSIGTENSNFFILSTCDKLAVLMSKSGNLTIMSLESSLELVIRVPYINRAIGTGSIAVSLGVKNGASKEGLLCPLFENTFLRKLLGSVRRVPELKFFHTDSDKSEVICLLGPGNVDDLVTRSLSGH